MPFFLPRRPANLRHFLVFVIFAFFTAAGGPVQAAELRVSKGTVIVEEGTAFVEVNVSWRLSWRTDTKWDAAWLFVKRRGGGQDPHVRLAPSGHRMVSNAHPDQPGASLTVPSDGMGAFVYRDAPTDERGANDWTLRLKVALSEDTALSDLPPTVTVYGVEMVYVPDGPFSVGDPQPTGEAPPDAFYEQTADTTQAPPYRITDSGPIPLCDGPGSLCSPEMREEIREDGRRLGSIPASYPNGYDAFYLMKYELTQGQYAAFLRSLSNGQTNSRDPVSGRTYEADRGTIALVGGQYLAGRPDRACNFLTWADAAAYMDWAGLRPMTEFEYTKAARGPAEPVADEFAWGSTTITHGDTIRAPGGPEARDEDGDEYVRGNANYDGGGGDEHVGGDGGAGPLRVDIFETRAHRTEADNLREASGAGYYGALDLTGSLFERAITATNEDGLRFQGTHGNGDLAYPARASNEDWPPLDGSGIGLRGGNYRREPNRGLRLADRRFGDYRGYYRGAAMGIRAARTAPPAN